MTLADILYKVLEDFWIAPRLHRITRLVHLQLSRPVHSDGELVTSGNFPRDSFLST